jgi:hypothetical protein
MGKIYHVCCCCFGRCCCYEHRFCGQFACIMCIDEQGARDREDATSGLFIIIFFMVDDEKLGWSKSKKFFAIFPSLFFGGYCFMPRQLSVHTPCQSLVYVGSLNLLCEHGWAALFSVKYTGRDFGYQDDKCQEIIIQTVSGCCTQNHFFIEFLFFFKKKYIISDFDRKIYFECTVPTLARYTA